jgi:hypothetical protein
MFRLDNSDSTSSNVKIISKLEHLRTVPDGKESNSAMSMFDVELKIDDTKQEQVQDLAKRQWLAHSDEADSGNPQADADG